MAATFAPDGTGYGRCPANVAGLRPLPGRQWSPSDGARGRVRTGKAETGSSWGWRCRLRRGVGERHRSEDAQRGICNSGTGSARGDRRRARLEHGRRPARQAALSRRRATATLSSAFEGASRGRRFVLPCGADAWPAGAVLRPGCAIPIASNSNRKESLMARITRLAMVAAVAAVGVLTFGAQPQAAGVKAGVLTCHETSGWGFIIGSTRDLSCVFSHPNGPPEHYT